MLMVKKHAETETLIKIAIIQQWTEISTQQLHNCESMFSSDWMLLWEIVEMGTVCNCEIQPDFIVEFCFY